MISNYLSGLISQRNQLADNLNAKGIQADNTETFNTLVPKVLEISGSGAQTGGIDKKLYSFGVLSDVHIRDTSSGAIDSTESIMDYQRALSYYTANGIDLVCIAGDILANNQPANGSTPRAVAETVFVNELTMFKSLSDEFSGEVHTCTGNHDATPLGYNNAPEGLGALVSVYQDGTKTAEQVWYEILGNPINYKFTRNGDVYIFLSMYYWNYVNFCRGSDNTWLNQQLESHKNERVFLFCHMPLPDTFDGPTATRSLTVLPEGQGGGSRVFKNIIERYPNVIWFNGHSHYELELEADFDNPNIYQSGESATMVHCPSATYTRKHVDGTDVNVNEASQGYVVDVYENKVVINGVDFAKGLQGVTVPVAQYVVNR